MEYEKKLSKASLKKMFKQAVDLSGVLDGLHPSELNNVYTFHSLRHTVGTEVTDKFGSEVAQELLGHASPRTTQTYNKMARKKKLSDKIQEVSRIFD